MPTNERISDDTVRAVSDWLIAQTLQDGDTTTIVGGFCERLQEAGFALMRVAVSTRVLHPNYAAETVVWRRGAAAEHERHSFQAAGPGEAWRRSPFSRAVETPEEPMRRNLTVEADLDFPILGEIRAEGGTDYYCRVIGFRTFGDPDQGQGIVSSWVTDRDGGFTAGEIDALERLLPRLAAAFKTTISHRIAREAMAVYLGKDAGMRVLSGQIHRGDATTISAVLLYGDLRDFTALTDRLPREELVAMLDGYFDAVVEPIQSNGGQVLKFMGDGLLATFSLSDRSRAETAAAAIDAVKSALAGIADVNRPRLSSDQPVMEMDFVLHLGDVMYGNVGSRSRLDFTVIGPVVNEASRIEPLCEELGTNVLISKKIFDCLGESSNHALAPLGEHRLRDVTGSRTLFTLP